MQSTQIEQADPGTRIREGGEAVILGLGRFFEGEHRVRNQVRSLTGRHRVCGYGSGGLRQLDEFHEVRMPPRIPYRIVKILGVLFPRLRIAFERRFYRSLAAELRARRPRLVIAHNILDGLIAVQAGVPFVFDSHEYLPRQFDGALMWRLMEIRYRRTVLVDLFTRASLITVEGETVAEAYAREFPGTGGKLKVVRNTPPYAASFPTPPRHSTRRRIIHHGLLVPERGLEMFFDIMAELGPEYELTLMGGGSNAGYIEDLKRKAAEAGNIIVKDPVPYERIVESLHGHDLSFVFFGSPHYHHRYMTVPNKFWESLQARVPAVVSPAGAMAGYVREQGCGIVPAENTVASYVSAIRALTDGQIASMKAKLEGMAYDHSLDAWIGGYADSVLSRVPAACPRILQITSHAFLPETRPAREGLSLRKAGYACAVLCPPEPGRPERESWRGMEVFRPRSLSACRGLPDKLLLETCFFSPAWHRALREVMAEWKPDVIHVHDIRLGRTAFLARREEKVVLDLHENMPAAAAEYLRGYRGAFKLLNAVFKNAGRVLRYERSLVWRCDRVITIVKEDRERVLRDHPGLPAAKVACVPDLESREIAAGHNWEDESEPELIRSYEALLGTERRQP